MSKLLLLIVSHTFNYQLTAFCPGDQLLTLPFIWKIDGLQVNTSPLSFLNGKLLMVLRSLFIVAKALSFLIEKLLIISRSLFIVPGCLIFVYCINTLLLSCWYHDLVSGINGCKAKDYSGDKVIR